MTVTPASANLPGVDEPPRGGWRTWAMVGGTVLALAALLSQVPSLSALWDTLKTAEWWWIAAAMGFTVGHKVGYAVALMGSVHQRLPVLRSIETLFAAAFANLAVPGVGSTTVQVRFLELQGVDLASAVAAGAVLANVANVVVQGALFLGALVFTAPTIDTSAIDLHDAASVVQLVVFLAGVCVAVAFGVPRFRRRTLPPTRRGVETIRTALRSPRQIALLVRRKPLRRVDVGVVPVRVRARVRWERGLLVAARGQHRRRYGRVTDPRAGWQHPRVGSRAVGRARDVRRAGDDGRRRGHHPAAHRRLPPRAARLVRDE